MVGVPIQARSRTDGGPAGFTLIELLVVLQIVALLIAILGPSLEAARRGSKNSVCLERLRGLGQASRIYQADDPNGLIIPVHPLQDRPDPYEPIYLGAYEWGGKSGVGGVGFVFGPTTGEFAFLTSRYGSKARFGPPTRPLNRILYPSGFKDARTSGTLDRYLAKKDTLLELDAYRCPADDGPPGGAHCRHWLEHPQRSAYDHFGNSYSANIMLIATVGGGEMRSNSPYLRPASRIPNPVRTLAYEENIGRWAWACRREQCDFMIGVDPGPTKAVRGWHGKNWTYNRAFIDAHAETQAVYLEGTEDADGYARHYRVEQVFDDPAQQESLRCVIIRGPGWQKDTYPAPDIPTGQFFYDQGRPSYEQCVREGVR